MSQIWHTHAFRNRGLPFFESALYPDLLHINLEPEFNVTTRLSTPNAPILLQNFPEQIFTWFFGIPNGSRFLTMAMYKLRLAL